MKSGSAVATALPAAAVGLEFSTVPAVPPHQEAVDTNLDATRERLLALRRQQEELERQKGELEELRRKQDEYARGRGEMIDHLTRGLVTLEREQLHAQRVAEQCDQATAAFRDYLDQLEAIDDEQWTSDTLRPELSRALGVIENARLEYNRARTRLDCLNPAAAPPGPAPVAAPPPDEWRELVRYAKLGAAASAPLILAITVWFLVWLGVR